MAGSAFTPKPMPLDMFSERLDAAYERSWGFADAVRQLWEARNVQAQVKKTREAVFSVVKDHYARGDRMVEAGADTLVLRETRPTAVEVTYTVPSDMLKRHDKRLWEKCKVVTPYVTARAPEGLTVDLRERGIVLPEVPDGRRLVDTLRAYRTVPKVDTWAEVEAEALEQLAAIEAGTKWSGDALVFSDGWGVGLHRMQYSSEALEQLDPDLFDQLAVAKEKGGSTRIYIGRPGDDDDIEVSL